MLFTDLPVIAPSVLSADFTDLKNSLSKVSEAKVLHFDVMDGNYVPEISFGTPILKALKQCTTIPVDVHLMVDNPEKQVDVFLDLGASMISFHAEAATHTHALIRKIKTSGAMAGVVLNPASPLAMIEEVLSDADFFLLMSVNPGFAGQKFIDGTLDKIKRLKAMLDERSASALIEVDGGINSRNIEQVIAAGTDIVVAGSAIFTAPDPEEELHVLQSIAAKTYLERKQLI